MSYSSDEFDGEIRGPLYELKEKITDNLADDPQSRFVLSGVEAAIAQADDYRIHLLDQEDAEEDRIMAEARKDDLGDAKLEEERDRRHGL